MRPRKSGILLHISSLPSPFGIGDLGPRSRQFADILREHRQSCWQILPLNPTTTAFGSSPYSSNSAFAGNPLLLSPEKLVEDGWLPDEALAHEASFPAEHVDFELVTRHKEALLHKAHAQFRQTHAQRERFERFCEEHAHWLDDYALFVTLKEHFGDIAWCDWPQQFRDRVPQALAQWSAEQQQVLEYVRFTQFLFFEQWHSLKTYCNGRQVELIGDIPIYVSYDSSDTWAHPELFKLDDAKKPLFVAGAPPDYFSETGQRWGNPVYDWAVGRETQYEWWVARMRHNLAMFDVVRLDHFRGFAAYWEIPAAEETAVNGYWVEGPRMALFKELEAKIGTIPMIAEDLGLITEDVKELLEATGFPGMKVLMFAFGHEMPKNPYIPHNVLPNSVMYTGTHDNNTARGWFQTEASQDDKHRLFDYLGRQVEEHEIHWFLIRLALMSVSELAIIPLQDILGLGAEARLNLPATTEGNWSWRALPEQLDNRQPFEHLRHLTSLFYRD